MASYDIEALRQADEAHRAAGASFDEAHEALLEARKAEHEAGLERKIKYERAFSSGFIIERILDPKKISYLAGIDNTSFDELDEDGHVWLKLDETHAESLQGAMAVDVRLYLEACRSIAPQNVPQQAAEIGFYILGMHSNVQPVADHIHRYRQPHSTNYSGELEAIEWRLPTEEEIQKYAGATAAAAA